MSRLSFDPAEERPHHAEDFVNYVLARLYTDFRERARRRMYGERVGHSLAATDLTNEALLRIIRSAEIAKASTDHQIFRAFARAMRQVLVDHARRRRAEKRGGHRRREEFDEFCQDVRRRCDVDVQVLDEALRVLGAELPREAAVIEMRYFGGFASHEIAAAVGVSLSTVERDSRFALSWLRKRFRED